MTLDSGLVKQVDQAAKMLKTTRSAFTRQALRDSLMRLRDARLEAAHKAGYARKPVGPGEFSGWEKEQVWDPE
jgi:predicted transcriptional regulator